MRFNGCDGTGFDVDYDQDGTVIQFNYSHDNEGGFILLCTDAEPRTRRTCASTSPWTTASWRTSRRARCARAPPTRGCASTTTRSWAPRLSWGMLGSPTTAPARSGRPRAAQQRLLRPPRAVRRRSAARRRCIANLCSACRRRAPRALAADPLLRDPARRGRGRIRVGPRLPAPPRLPGRAGAGTPVARIPARGLLRRAGHQRPRRAASPARKPPGARECEVWAPSWARRHGFRAAKVCVISAAGEASPPRGNNPYAGNQGEASCAMLIDGSGTGCGFSAPAAGRTR